MTTTPGSHAYSDPAGSQDSSAEEDRSLGEIIGDVARDLTTLIRQEITLAKTEAKDEAVKAGKAAGKSAGLLGGAGVAGHLFLIFFSLFLTFLIAEWFDSLWAGALIVAVLWGIVAAVLASMGRKKLKEVDPPKMETTTQTLKEDAQWVKTRNES